ncbi:unnamed protein product [Euphydryas editha]|uniref:Uncharacterized protein n=1 Tax=Euphydryas editha TaxID=104508 RepID=A0AAU9VCG4_EUPED|nr:unnamed protein product [Euphydryas editha]
MITDCGDSGYKGGITHNINMIRQLAFLKHFFLMRTDRNGTLPASVFPDNYNLGIFKSRVNRLLLRKRTPY